MRSVNISAIALSAALAIGLTGSASAADNVAATKHNLSTGGTGTFHADGSATGTALGTAEVCVYCHTPHAADTTVGVVLWNRAINSSGYTMYNSDTLDNAIAGQPEGVSLACLSCHDGTLAFDQLINGPGPGDYDPTAASRGWTFVGGNSLLGAGVTEIGQDLSNDHPVSVSVDTVGAGTGVDPNIALPAAITGAGLNLYTGTNSNQVECASCHNPHEADTNLAPFLRLANTGSQLCTTCHDK